MANVRVGKAFVEIAAELDRLEKDFRKVKARARRAGDEAGRDFDRSFTGRVRAGLGRLKSFVFSVRGAIVGAFAFAGFRIAKDFVKAFATQESAVERLRASLKATGKDGAESLEAITAEASRLQQMTKQGDEAIISATASLAQLAPSLDAAELVKAETAIVAIAETFLKGDVEGAALLLGKTVGSSTNALSRYGIQLDATGTASEKLAQITGNDVLGAAFKVAQANAETLEGRLVQLNNAKGDLKETIGGLIVDFVGFQDKTEGATNKVQAFDAWLTENRTGILKFGKFVLALGSELLNLIQIVGDTIALIVSGIALAIQDMVNLGIRGINGLIAVADKITPGQLGRVELVEFTKAAETWDKATSNLARNVGEFGGAMNRARAEADALDAAGDSLESTINRAGQTIQKTTGDLEDFAAELEKLGDEGVAVSEPLELSALDRADARLKKLGLSIVQFAPLAKRLGLTLDEFAKGLEAAGELTLELVDATDAEDRAQRSLNEAFRAGDRAMQEQAQARKELIRDLLDAARAGLDVAKTLGLVGDKGASIISSAINVGSAAGRVATGDVAGGLLQGIPALGGLLSGIFGGGPSATEMFEGDFAVQFAILRSDAAALQQVANELDSLLVPLRKLFEDIGELGNSLVKIDGGKVVLGVKADFDELRKAMGRTGITLAELRRAARAAGVDVDELTKVLATGKGDRDLAAAQFNALNDILAILPESTANWQAALDTLDKRLGSVSAKLDVFDIEDPASKFIAIFEQIAFTFAGSDDPFGINAFFQKRFGDFIAGLTPEFLSTEAGRAEAERVLRDFFSFVPIGLGGAQIFDVLGLDPGQIAALDALLEQIEDAANAASGAVTRPRGATLPSITQPELTTSAPIQRSLATEVQFEEQLALGRTQLFELQGIRAEIAISNGLLRIIAGARGTVGEVLARSAQDVTRRTGGVTLP